LVSSWLSPAGAPPPARIAARRRFYSKPSCNDWVNVYVRVDVWVQITYMVGTYCCYTEADREPGNGHCRKSFRSQWREYGEFNALDVLDACIQARH
jgi:hypothetical protein